MVQATVEALITLLLELVLLVVNLLNVLIAEAAEGDLFMMDHLKLLVLVPRVLLLLGTQSNASY
jgi:hypothetical protein